MKQDNIIYVNNPKVKCEEAPGGIGHPRVYLEIKEDKIICPYCSKIFILNK